MDASLVGIGCALTAALFWAFATGFYRQMAGFWTPAALAFIKASIATTLFLIWFLLFDIDFWQHEPSTLAWLFLSGVIGIGIGDTALFYALYRMTERETLIVAETAAPIFVVATAYVMLAENLTLLQLTGIVLVIIGVDGAIGLRRGSAHFDAIGIVFAIIAAACQAFGMIVSRIFLTQTDISAEETALWRMMGAAMFLPFWLILRKESIFPAKRLVRTDVAKLFTAIIFGTFLGILLMQLAVAMLPAGLAQTLIATSIIFATIIGVARGDIVTRGQWAGVVIAVSGVAAIVL